MCKDGPNETRRYPLARALHWLYKHTFAFLTVGACRFHPTCSDYGLEAIEAHGWCKGGILTVQRLIRCHPWNPGGVDPVP